MACLTDINYAKNHKNYLILIYHLLTLNSSSSEGLKESVVILVFVL